jgi:hypothetical protein
VKRHDAHGEQLELVEQRQCLRRRGGGARGMPDAAGGELVAEGHDGAAPAGVALAEEHLIGEALIDVRRRAAVGDGEKSACPVGRGTRLPGHTA